MNIIYITGIKPCVVGEIFLSVVKLCPCEIVGDFFYVNTSL